MSRTEPCACTPIPVFRYQEHQPRQAPVDPPRSEPRDRIGTTHPGARQKLADLAHPGGPEPGKLEGGQARSPSPELERDPAVERYRWNPSEHRYQVTKYDPRKLAFTREGRPLTGSVVQLDGRSARVDDAAQIIRGRAAARLKAVETLEQTPWGSKVLLSSPWCQPVKIALDESLRHCKRADELLRAGKGSEAGRALVDAARSYDAASKLLNTARPQIEKNVVRTVQGLQAIKIAGEVAEFGLMVVGVGAATKGVSTALKAAGKADWLISAARIATGTLIKTAHGAADRMRDHATFRPGEPVDWKGLAENAAHDLLWNTISSSVGEAFQTAGVAKPGTGVSWQQLAAKLNLVLARAAFQAARAADKPSTPQELLRRTVIDLEARLEGLLTKSGLEVQKGVGKVLLQALIRQFVTR